MRDEHNSLNRHVSNTPPSQMAGIREALERLSALQSEAAETATMVAKTFSQVLISRTCQSGDPMAAKVARPSSDLATELNARVTSLSESLNAIRDVCLASDL